MISDFTRCVCLEAVTSGESGAGITICCSSGEMRVSGLGDLRTSWVSSIHSVPPLVASKDLVAVPRSNVFDIESWQPYIVDGKLSVRGSISMCM